MPADRRRAGTAGPCGRRRRPVRAAGPQRQLQDPGRLDPPGAHFRDPRELGERRGTATVHLRDLGVAVADQSASADGVPARRNRI